MKIGDGGDKIEVGIAGFIPGPIEGSKAVGKLHVFEDDEVPPPLVLLFCFGLVGEVYVDWVRELLRGRKLLISRKS